MNKNSWNNFLNFYYLELKNVNNLNNIFYTEPINLDGNYPLIEDKSPKDEQK